MILSMRVINAGIQVESKHSGLGESSAKVNSESDFNENSCEKTKTC
jgi:hypothetical protein